MRRLAFRRILPPCQLALFIALIAWSGAVPPEQGPQWSDSSPASLSDEFSDTALAINAPAMIPAVPLVLAMRPLGVPDDWVLGSAF